MRGAVVRVLSSEGSRVSLRADSGDELKEVFFLAIPQTLLHGLPYFSVDAVAYSLYQIEGIFKN